MKKMISILLLGTLPMLAQASGDHGHSGHDMANSGHSMEHQQGGHDMAGMSHDEHEAAAGRPGDASKVTRTIKVSMNNTMQFTPNRMKFKAGDTVRFEVSNSGKIRHEMVIGTMSELKEHAQMMRKMPGMKHDEANMISLAPGQKGEMIWQFDKAGSFDFACMVPGHLEAGMTGRIVVR